MGKKLQTPDPGYSGDVSPEQFARIRPLLESASKKTKPLEVDLRAVFNATLYTLREGCRWRALPRDFPPPGTVYCHFRKWRDRVDPASREPFEEYVGEALGAEVEVARRSEPHTFAVIPKRWAVERSISWLENCQRLWKNCERKLGTSLAMMRLAFISMLLRRASNGFSDRMKACYGLPGRASGVPHEK